MSSLRMNPFRCGRHVFATDLSHAQCAERIGLLLRASSAATPVRGFVRGDFMRIGISGRRGFYSPIARGRLATTEQGTRVDLLLGPNTTAGDSADVHG
jgi:hypothetical protein